jgi:tetratricopeptide (TPR) repeat protein
MTFRKIAAIGLVGLTAALIGNAAQAAVTVLGNSIARACYENAEFGGDAREGLRICILALDETATTMRDRAATLINLGIVQSRNDDAEGAMSSYNRGLRIDPTLGEGYVDRGAAELVLKDYRAALGDFDRGLQLNANKPEIAYYDRAIANEALGNIRDAYIDYKKAVELRPDFALASQQLSRFKVVRRKPDGA